MMNKNSSTSAGDYQKSLAKHGESPKALLWPHYRAAAIRYKELVADIPLEGKTILDVGCGMGDLLPFLYSKSNDFSYLGVDINKDFIDIAKKRYEGHEFKVANPFSKKIGNYDVVVSSGVMNGNVDDWLEKRKKAIAHLFEMTNETLAFNMAGGLNDVPNTSLIAYAKLEDIQAFCATLASRLIVRNHYSKTGFTIVS